MIAQSPPPGSAPALGSGTDAGTAVGQGGSKIVEGNGNLYETKKSLPIMLASVKQQFWPQKNKRNYRKFVSIRSWYTMKLSMMLLWKRHLHPVPPPFWKVRGEMPPLSGVPGYRYQQALSCCITCQDVCVQQSHATKSLLSQLEVMNIRFVAMLLLHNKDQQ